MSDTKAPEQPRPTPEALDAALDFLWPTYRPNLSRDEVRQGDIQCWRLAAAMEAFVRRQQDKYVDPAIPGPPMASRQKGKEVSNTPTEQPTPELDDLDALVQDLRDYGDEWSWDETRQRINRFATKRAAEAVAALHCAACDGPYPNPDCPHLRNARDMGERIPCAPAQAAAPPPGDADDIRTLPDSSNRSADIGVVESAAKTEAHSTSAPCGAATVETSLSTVTPPGDAGERARNAIARTISPQRWANLNAGEESHVLAEAEQLLAAALQSERTAAASQARRETIAECARVCRGPGNAVDAEQRIRALATPQESAS